MNGQDYAIGICPQMPCQSDLHVWSSPRPQGDHRCHCGAKAWSEVTLAAGVDPTPVEPFYRKDLQALRETLPSGVTLANLVSVVRRYPGTIKRLINQPTGD